MAFETVTITVAGQVLAPVTIGIRIAQDEAARSFEAKVKHPLLSQAALLNLLAGSPACTIRAGSDLILTGHVEKRSPSLGGEEKTLPIAGRSKTGDLVDSAHDHPKGEMRDKTAKDMLSEVAAPFGIAVETDADLQKRKVARLRPGETPFRFGERLARVEGVSLTDTAEGHLKLAGPPKKRHAGAITDGDGWPVIISASAVHDDSKRVQEVKVRAQAPDGYGAPALEIEETARDASVTRKRLRVITPPEEISKAEARKRAKHHRDRAAGAGTTAEVTVKGWRDVGGTIWTPGWLIPVHIADLGLAQEMMIESVALNQTDADGDGTSCTLSLVDPRAYGGKAGKGAKSGKGWDLGQTGGDDV